MGCALFLLMIEPLGFGHGAVLKAMAAELRTRPRYDATIAASPRYTAQTNTSPRESGTVGVNY